MIVDRVHHGYTVGCLEVLAGGGALLRVRVVRWGIFLMIKSLCRRIVFFLCGGGDDGVFFVAMMAARTTPTNTHNL